MLEEQGLTYEKKINHRVEFHTKSGRARLRYVSNFRSVLMN